MTTVGSLWMWIGFMVFVLAMLALDLGVFHRKAHEVHYKEALGWTGVWIGLALAFNVLIYVWFGPRLALEFTTGYVIEKALSVDNIFVFLVLLSYFQVPPKLQHRVLYWGILGAIVLRGVFILAGAALLQRFHWVLFIFGAVLVLTGIKLLIKNEEPTDPAANPVTRLFQKLVPIEPGYQNRGFVIVKDGKRYATTLLLVLVAVETTDIVFAIDSIPAVFAITRDPFIVYTSNIFAILGLRALYFLLSGMMQRFAYLRVGLALVLMFVGAKMLLSDLYKVPIGISLAIVALLIAGSVVFSWLRPAEEPKLPTPPEPDNSPAD